MRRFDAAMPRRIMPDELEVQITFSDGVALMATRHIDAIIDDKVQVCIGWEQLADVCAEAVNHFGMEEAVRFLQRFAHKQLEALDAIDNT
jgi:uncharacterized protein with von Willebrand factor type A (vWA) domain